MRKGVSLLLVLCLLAATVCAVAESEETDRGTDEAELGTWLLTVGDLVPTDGDASVYFLSVCLTPGRGSEGVTGPRGQVGVVMFSVTLPASWQLYDANPGDGTRAATVTVSCRAGEGTWWILMDGPMQLEDGGELVVLTVKNTSTEPVSGGAVTVCPAQDSPYIYYLEGNGSMTAISLTGCTSEISPHRTQQETNPAASGAESETGTEAETEMETVPIQTTSTETDAEAGTGTGIEPDVPAGVIYVGCQEAGCGGGLFSVRFLFLVPEAEAGQRSGAVWVSGGGTATLSVSTAAAVTVWEGRHTTVTKPEEGYLFCILTYTGLQMAGRYIFTVDTGLEMIRILYEGGIYGGMTTHCSGAWSGRCDCCAEMQNIAVCMASMCSKIYK